MDIKKELNKRTAEVDAVIRRFLPKETGRQKTVIEAMNYSVLAGGKRLRPMLMQETFRMFHGTTDMIEPFMAALEMIHTYSLIHDDLPAMDNDEYRRGKKTTHAVYGEAMAILAGDGLLNFAYETAASALAAHPEDANGPKAFVVLAQKAGIYGMVGGQTVDVENDGRPLDSETLDFINSLKTGALIEAAMMVGAILAGADNDSVRKISQAARDIGRAFQIRDDILDVQGDPGKLGKPVGSDLKNEKTTYVSQYGLEKAGQEVRMLSDRACHVLNSFSGDSRFLQGLIHLMEGREK